jgi:hypothetical protein
MLPKFGGKKYGHKVEKDYFSGPGKFNVGPPPIRFQLGWISWSKLKIEWWNFDFGFASLFLQVISNWLSLSYQTKYQHWFALNGQSDDSTRLETIGYLERYPNHVIQLVGKSQLGRLGRIEDTKISAMII